MRVALGNVMMAALVCLWVGCTRQAPIPTDFSKTNFVKITLADPAVPEGIYVTSNSGDGRTAPAKMGGKGCRHLEPHKKGLDAYIYFTVAVSFITNKPINLKATVEYFDAAPASFFMEFDGSDAKAKHGGAYSRAEEEVQLTGDQKWKVAKFTLHDCIFEHRQNGGADLRIRVKKSELYIHSVTLEHE
jgi:hypothetical protein